MDYAGDSNWPIVNTFPALKAAQAINYCGVGKFPENEQLVDYRQLWILFPDFRMVERRVRIALSIS